MILQIAAAGEGLVSLPPRNVGQLPRYVNREYVAETRSWPACREPQKIETAKLSPELQASLRRKLASGELFAADVDTAAWAGVAFVPLKWTNGVWEQTKPAEKAGKKAE
jgi:hypothetical protein